MVRAEMELLNEMRHDGNYSQGKTTLVLSSTMHGIIVPCGLVVTRVDLDQQSYSMLGPVSTGIGDLSPRFYSWCGKIYISI